MDNLTVGNMVMFQDHTIIKSEDVLEILEIRKKVVSMINLRNSIKYYMSTSLMERGRAVILDRVALKVEEDKI